MADNEQPSNNPLKPAVTANAPAGSQARPNQPAASQEVGGRGGPDPTRYGDWEIGGRCIDF